MSERARVFISCGQRKDTEEVKIATEIANELTVLGFEPYIAVTEQTLKGVKENIFTKLRETEYFLFIDFKRERLFKGNDPFLDTGNYRGSLFSHQELSIATYEDYEVLAFQEESVKKDDGILKFIQANCIPFTDVKSLPSFVIQKVKERGWNPNWRNTLSLNRLVTDYEDPMSPRGRGRFYHVRVFNNHKSKIARNCFAYVEGIKNINTGQKSTFELVELKWKGIKKETVSIVPKSFRYLDAFNILFSQPAVANLGLNDFLIDWSGYREMYRIIGLGDYEVDYVIFSENFSPARAKFILHMDAQIQNTAFNKALFI